MRNIANRSIDMNGGMALSRRQVEQIVKFDADETLVMQNFNYDPHFQYRKHINKQPDNIKQLCYIYWYLEGYYFRLREYATGFEYTYKLCKRLKLDAAKVCEEINNNIFNYL